ncbi:hypothetical protein GCU60_07585 [Blastococcus saxobsidens]|uniref:SCP2 domain-containing protein n=1 Tax=Blastococcus saxobsidens TaxID=138336 RepID=A0A6L9W1A3_9ACTN|nr:hypothetical protein [Blastococcus saxobsidens]NEK85622.1 hypothetical protein [Blastococcus saxobsidens]
MIPERLAGWARAVAHDPENAHIGRFTAFTARLVDDRGGDVLVSYDHGAVTVEDGVPGADLELRGPVSAWRELVDPDAAPRRHDLLALTKAPDGIEVVSGREQLIRHLRVITRLVQLARAAGDDGAEVDR